MNSFDLAVYAALAIAIGFGFRTGLLGSAMTILAYLLAAPIAVALMPLIVPQIAGNPNAPLLQNWIWFFGIFVVVGMLFGNLGAPGAERHDTRGRHRRPARRRRPRRHQGRPASPPPWCWCSTRSCRPTASRRSSPARICGRCSRRWARWASSRCRRRRPPRSTASSRSGASDEAHLHRRASAHAFWCEPIPYQRRQGWLE